MADDHYSKPDSERSGPYRSFDNFYRWPDFFSWWLPAARAEPSAEAKEAPANEWSSRTQEAVGDAYRMIESQMRQGYDIADSFNRQFTEMGRAGGDLQDVTNRMLWSSYDMAAGWIEFMTSLPMSMMSMMAPPGARNGARNGAAGDAVSVVVTSAPGRSVEDWKLDLAPGAVAKELKCNPLRSPNTKKTISKISFGRKEDGGGTVLRIHVTENTPTGVYSGAIQDQNGYAQGTLTVILD